MPHKRQFLKQELKTGRQLFDAIGATDNTVALNF